MNILLAKHDRDRKYDCLFGLKDSGEIDFEEFKSLLDEVWKWKVRELFTKHVNARTHLIILI